eukprot:1868948-Rhodomonas_salina.1
MAYGNGDVRCDHLERDVRSKRQTGTVRSSPEALRASRCAGACGGRRHSGGGCVHGQVQCRRLLLCVPRVSTPALAQHSLLRTQGRPSLCSECMMHDALSGIGTFDLSAKLCVQVFSGTRNQVNGAAFGKGIYLSTSASESL